MFNNVIPTEIKATNFENKSALNGVDLMTSIQMLLVQNYDDQLKDTANQIKLTTKVKKAYREKIQELNKMLNKKTQKKGNDDCVYLSIDERYRQAHDYNIQADMTTGEVRAYRETYSPCGEVQREKDQNEDVKGYWVKVSAIENHVESYKQKLDSLNEQTELMSISLQSLTNQRKVCFETITNIVKKTGDCLSGIVRNV
ncbi:MAG: hypothetical protein ABII18_07660 [bacterium]|nr:hypothetical protein [bacterium]MBU1917294.1 hypothetical protein [bacterium]